VASWSGWAGDGDEVAGQNEEKDPFALAVYFLPYLEGQGVDLENRKKKRKKHTLSMHDIATPLTSVDARVRTVLWPNGDDSGDSDTNSK
jgi:hypothetical protein